MRGYLTVHYLDARTAIRRVTAGSWPTDRTARGWFRPDRHRFGPWPVGRMFERAGSRTGVASVCGPPPRTGAVLGGGRRSSPTLQPLRFCRLVRGGGAGDPRARVRRQRVCVAVGAKEIGPTGGYPCAVAPSHEARAVGASHSAPKEG